jgi:hypothetical protein
MEQSWVDGKCVIEYGLLREPSLRNAIIAVAWGICLLIFILCLPLIPALIYLSITHYGLGSVIIYVGVAALEILAIAACPE